MILRPIQMVRACRITHATNAYFGGHGLQLAVATDLAGQAVQRMIREHKFDNVFAQLAHFRRFGEDMHPGG